jgi:serine/threonine-protein kinase
MLTCPQCHEQFPTGTAVCPHDGAALDDAAARDAARTAETVEAPHAPAVQAQAAAAAATASAPLPVVGPDAPTPIQRRRVVREEALSPTLRQDDLAAVELTGSSKERVAARDQSLGRPDAMVGRTLVDRFAITRKLGEGGMGAVYEARHTLIGKRVAIKILLDKYAQKESVIARLQQEARLASSIGHPNIVDITDFGKTEDGRTFVVMEYLDGESLAQLIGREGPLAPERALQISRQVADALTAAHGKGIVHRDIKPENVFLIHRDGKEFVKVVDFGISKHLKPGEEEEETPRLTQTGMVLGTPLYMSPEQARGEDSLDQRIDIYAVGVILYEMVTNEVPFRGTNYLGIISQVLTQDVVPPRLLRPDLAISEACERVILKAMAKNRDERYATMAELSADLDRLLSGDQNVVASIPAAGVASAVPAGARGPTLRGITTQLGRRQVPLLAVVAALVVLLGVGFGVAWLLTRGGERGSGAIDGAALAAATSQPASQPASAAASQPASQPAFVKVRIKTRPLGAVVRIGDRDYGPAPVEATLPRGDKPLQVRAQAAGHDDATDSFTPARDVSMTLALSEKKKPVRPGVRVGPAPTGTKAPGGPIDETAPSPYKPAPKK